MISNKILIGLSGGSGSGKTTIAMALADYFGDKAFFISEDDYYKDTSIMEGFGTDDFDFDDPIIRDHDLLIADLKKYHLGIEFEHPLYDFTNHCRKTETKKVIPKPILIMEGTHLFVNPQVRDEFTLKIFVHTDEEIRYKRRLKRDICERGRTPECVQKMYENIVKPAHYKFTEPTKGFADLILDCNDAPNKDQNQIIMEHVYNISSKIGSAPFKNEDK